jgi:hypothetical protein
MVANLQAATCAQGVFWSQKASQTCQVGSYVDLLAAAAIFRHGLPKIMLKMYENVELSSEINLIHRESEAECCFDGT